MKLFRGGFIAMVAVAAASGQMLPVQEQQPDTLMLPTNVRLALPRAPEGVREEVNRLVREGNERQRAGRTGEMRRKLAEAVTIMAGRKWDAEEEYRWSLALRPDRVVSEPSGRVTLWLTQYYPAGLAGVEGMQLRVKLVGAAGSSEVGRFDVWSTDLIDQPFVFRVPLGKPGLGSGSVRVRAELEDRGTVRAAVEAELYVAPGIVSRRAEVDGRLKKIAGHEGTKASIRFPYVLAETVNSGRRRLNQADFGIPFTAQPVFDFAGAMRRSDELLAALESGKDLLWQAKGDVRRHYWLEDAKEMMPYRMYVPKKWDGRSKLPMVLVLHGATRDENFYFDRDGGILARLAEEHGFLVVCPLGYRPTGGWGASSLAKDPKAVGAARLRMNELSEKDGLSVFELVKKEYPIDEDRTYLFGHSMGGGGTWYFGQKFQGRWAAMAASASGIMGVTAEDIPYDRLKGTPLMVIVGDKDPAAPNVRTTVRLAKEHGLDPYFFEAAGATHETIVALAEPKVFEFFEKHRRR